MGRKEDVRDKSGGVVAVRWNGAFAVEMAFNCMIRFEAFSELAGLTVVGRERNKWCASMWATV